MGDVRRALVRDEVSELPSLPNFRDAGDGSPIRAGVLYRADSPSAATPEDAAALVAKYQIATVIDLRDTPEVAAFGRGPLAGAPVAYENVPMGDIPLDGTVEDFSVALLAAHGDRIVALLRSLALPGRLPVLIHCHVGCDRTGVVIAAALALAGVPAEEIAEDYGRSTKADPLIRERSIARRNALGLPQMDAAYYAAYEPVPARMLATLARVDERWGSMAGWARAYGMTDAEIGAVRAALADPAPVAAERS